MSTAIAQREKKQMPAVLPMQRRFFEVRAKKESDGLTPISFSSDTPVKRNTWMGYWWYEVLNHDRSAVDTGRLEQGISVLVNHDPDQRAGLLKNGAIEKGKGRGDIKFNTTDFGKSVRQEVEDGTLPYISVGYRVNEMNRAADINSADDEDEDYLGTYSVDRWEPLEVSLVAVPADPSVGVGRSLDQAPQYPVAIRRAIETASAGNSQEATRMATTATVPTPDQAAITAQVRTAELARFAELDAVHSQYPEFFTAEQRSTFARENRTGDEARRHVLAEMAKRSSSTAAHPATGSPAAEFVRDEADKRPGSLIAARFIRCMAAGRGNKADAARFAGDVLKDGMVQRALSASIGSQGGFTLPDTISADIIEFLRPMTVVRALNPTLAPLPNGTLTMSKLTGGVAAGYIGENKDITATQQTFGQVKMAAKKLACLVPISNDLIRYQSGIAADSIVRDDMASGIAQAEDAAFIRGAGTSFSPKGLRNWAVAANLIAANGTINLANVVQDLGKLRLALRKANVRFLRPGWIMSPRTENFLLTLLTVNGVYAFRDEMMTGKLWNLPYKVTTLIPENLGAGSDSELYLADFADVVIGEVPNIVVETSTEASYFDGAQLQSAFSLDQTVIKLIIEHDLAVRHQESIAVLTGVQWT
jgi:HK97 family phage major capsid protein